MFSKKSIRVEVQKIAGEFYPGVGVLEFKDLPIEADLNFVTLPSGISGRIKIYGVSKSHMDAITTLRKQVFIDQKAVRVYVNDGDGEDLLFEGNIMSAVPDYNSAPDVCITIDACAGAYYNLKSDVSPSIAHKGASVPFVFQEICKSFDYNCVPHGTFNNVSSEQVFDQIGLSNRLNAAARAYNVYVVMSNKHIVDIYPNGEDYEGKNWIFTKESYIGYPSFNSVGIEIKLDRWIKSLSLADFFTIKNSEVSAANDKWKVLKIKYNFSTKIGGKWVCTISGLRVGVGQPTVLAGLNLT